jgi:hypothetical protein
MDEWQDIIPFSTSLTQPAYTTNMSITFTQSLYYFLSLRHMFLTMLTLDLLQLSFRMFSPYIQSYTMRGHESHTKGTLKEHALYTSNLKAHWRIGKPCSVTSL